MKPKAFVCALVAMSLVTGACPVFGQAEGNEQERAKNFQQIQRVQQWQARHGYQPPPGMRVYPEPGQPIYQQPGQPGYQYEQPGRPDYQPRGNDRRYSDRGAGPNHDFYPGQRLPPLYRNHNYVVNDWRAHRLTAPPPGYYWVQTGADYVLIAIATGLIVQLLLSY